MTTLIVAMLAGFSVIAALLLLFVYQFFLSDMRKTTFARLACAAMLCCLAGLQAAHYHHLILATELLHSRLYGVLLSILPAAFLFFGREALFLSEGWQRRDFLHLLPIAVACVLPVAWIAPWAFTFGALYTAGFTIQVVRLRRHTRRFHFELFFFGLFFLMALLALTIGLLLPWLSTSIFVHVYSASMSLALLLILTALLVFPELLSDLLVITETTYRQSRLNEVNTDAKLVLLEQVMVNEQLFEQENLDLGTLADAVGLSSHQLSELINSHFGHGFPRYVREHRVRAAKHLLLSEPKASVLSISMSTGFKSQSSFYAAFKELTTESPGQFRQRELSNSTPDL